MCEWPPQVPAGPAQLACLRRRFAVGGMTTGLRHRVGTMQFDWRAGGSV